MAPTGTTERPSGSGRGAGTDPRRDTEDAEPVGSSMTWPLAIVLALAVGILGVAVGKLVFKPDHPGVGSVDVGFMQDMRLHHDQAVEMSFIYLNLPTNGVTVTLRSIATEIIQSQQLENGLMVQTLRDWDQVEQNETTDAMGWMGMLTDVRQMPGMASAQDLDQLSTKSGVAAAKSYVELMIAHHQGGIHMAEYAAIHAKSSAVRKMAAAMASGQRSEVNELTKIQGSLGA